MCGAGAGFLPIARGGMSMQASGLFAMGFTGCVGSRREVTQIHAKRCQGAQAHRRGTGMHSKVAHRKANLGGGGAQRSTGIRMYVDVFFGDFWGYLCCFPASPYQSTG